jgi:hypothetical protein
MLFVIIYAYWCPTRFPYQMMFVSFNSNTTGFRCGAGTAKTSGAHEFIAVFSGVRDARSLAFCVCFVDHLSFVLFLLDIVLSVPLRCTASDYLFGIFKLFLMIFDLTKSGWCFTTCSVSVYEYMSLYRTIPNSNRWHFI